MATYHTVKQGEHLSRIAKQYGFVDYQTVWDQAENAVLKQQRQNPNVLFPGDRLFIPDRQGKTAASRTEQRHRFRLRGRRLMLQIKLEKSYDGPIANTPCELCVECERFPLTTDGNGMVQHEIPKTASRVRLVIKETLQLKDKVVPRATELAVQIGHLDPVEERSGQRGRLANLGYYRGPLDQVDEAELLSAIEEFQCEHGLVVDGKCGPLTQAKLKQVHGC
jgi:hypothetical protein